MEGTLFLCKTDERREPPDRKEGEYDERKWNGEPGARSAPP